MNTYKNTPLNAKSNRGEFQSRPSQQFRSGGIGTFFGGRSASPVFEMRFSARAMFEFILEALMIFLFASVPKLGYALSLGFFAGLIFARQNLLLLAPVYIISGIVFSLNWWTLLYVGTPVILLLILYFIFYKLHRNVPITGVASTAMISMVPYAVCNGVFGADIFVVVLSAAVGTVFSVCCSIILYALLCRKAVKKFTLDEQISGGIFILIFAYAFSGLTFDGFNFNMLLIGFFVLLCADCFMPQTTLFLALLIGAGEALGFGNISYIGDAVLLAAIAVALSSFTKYASAAGMIAVESALWLMSAYSGSGWKPLVLIAAGAFVYAVMPKSVTGRIKGVSKKGVKSAVNSLVNRNRTEMSSKLFSVSDVFYDMSKNMEKAVDVNGKYSPAKLAGEIAKNYCGKCGDREICFGQLGGDTAAVLEPMTHAAMSRGKATILDMPPFITGRCSKMNNLVSVINSSADAYRKRRDEADEIENGKKLMSEQFAGIALVLDSMARDCGEQVNFSEDANYAIETELLKHNIVPEEIVITALDGQTGVTLTVRASDADKAVLPRIVSAKLRTRLEITDIFPKGDKKVVHLENSPIFEVAYGVAEHIRGGEGVSGDSKSILCPSRRRRLFAVSDGMGSGAEAAEASRDAISMVESFYRAGFDNAIILSLVNKLLKLNKGDCFSSLDIAVIDTVTGGMDVIKLGSADSYIIHGDSVESISSLSPPAGILDNVQPVTNRMQLMDGDMVIIMSDGVADALDTLGVMDSIREADTKNPQTLADVLLKNALLHGAEDDCTALVLRLFLL